MGRSPCCDENGLKKGPWTPEEDQKLVDYINKHGHGSWRALPKLAGLNRCGKSCRLRWTNYLRPDIKRGKFSQEEEQTILHLHSMLGNKWSAIATNLPGRTDNEIKNFWNTHLKKKLILMGYDPMTHRPRTDLFSSLPGLIALANLLEHHQLEEHAARLQEEAVQLAKLQYLQCLLQSSSSSNTQFDLEAVANLSQFENQASFQIENASSQLLQLPIIDPQVHFDFQTHLDNNNDHHHHLAQNSSNFAMLSQQEDNNTPNSSWFLPSPASSTLPHLTETSISNAGETSSSSSNAEGVSSYWSELLFEEPHMHEIS